VPIYASEFDDKAVAARFVRADSRCIASRHIALTRGGFGIAYSAGEVTSLPTISPVS
jgi:hypothetical protein